MLDLSLRDTTQRQLYSHLLGTEQLIAQAAEEASGREASSEIILLPDLGLPHNVTRILGGFFTGAFYRWDCSIPFVPVDATVNVDTVSVYHVAPPFGDRCGFYEAINRAAETVRTSSTFSWNFDVGNHFITWARLRNSNAYADGDYLVLHASASEFKWQHNGLYPARNNWYADSVKCTVEAKTGRYLRYICGSIAEHFIEIANTLVTYNRVRHQYIAGLICGTNRVLKEVMSIPHYGMPASNAIAIGSQCLMLDQDFLLLTAPTKPMFLVHTRAGGTNEVVLAGQSTFLHPHGLGKRSKGPLSLDYCGDKLQVNGSLYCSGDTLEDNSTLELRDIDEDISHIADQNSPPEIVRQMLTLCPGEIVGELRPVQGYWRGNTRCQ